MAEKTREKEPATTKHDSVVSGAGTADEVVKGHALKKAHFSNATLCDVCKTKIWGIGKAGYKCTACDLVVHKKCVEDIQNECSAAISQAPPSKEERLAIQSDVKIQKFAEVIKGSLQQGSTSPSEEKTLPRLVSAPVKIVSPKQPTPSVEPDPNAVPTFGSHLETLMDYERSRGSNLPVPIIVSKSLKFLFECGLGVEGLFRVPGASQRMNAIIEKYNKGLGPVIDYKKEGCSEADVSSILKKYFRDLPEPLFTNELQDKFQSLVAIQDVNERNQKFKEYFKLLPVVNREITRQFLFFLNLVSANSNINLMTTENLATIFGTMAGVFFSFDHGPELVAHLIDYYPDIFEADELAVTKGPYFRKKLVGHTRSILRLIYAGNYIWSFDSSGVVRIWDPTSMSFVKNFNSGQKLFSLPILVDQTIWAAAATDILIFDINAPGAPPVQKIPIQGCACITRAGDYVWVGGQNLTVFDSKTYQMIEDLTDYKNDMTLAMDYVSKYVWTWRAKTCFLYDPQTRKKVREIPNLVTSKPAIFAEIENNIWIGCEDGSILVLDQETFEQKAKLTEHTGCVYHIIKIGKLVWTCSWDKTILCWDPQKFQFAGRLPSLHTDAVSWILPLWYEDKKAWQVWTASWDRSIHVWYVPTDYEGHLAGQDALQHFTVTSEKTAPSRPLSRPHQAGPLTLVLPPQASSSSVNTPPLPDPSVPIPPPIAVPPQSSTPEAADKNDTDRNDESQSEGVSSVATSSHRKSPSTDASSLKGLAKGGHRPPPSRPKAISQSAEDSPVRNQSSIGSRKGHAPMLSVPVLPTPQKTPSSNRNSVERRSTGEGQLQSTALSLTNTIETLSGDLRNLKKERDNLENNIAEQLKKMTVELHLNDFLTESAKYTAHKSQLDALHRKELEIAQQIAHKTQELLQAKQTLRLHQVREEVEQAEKASST